MDAVRAHAQGGPETLRHAQAPIPEPGIGGVLVRVHAASFTPTELAWPSTSVDRAGRDRSPVIPAPAANGAVVGIGDATTGFQAGDIVDALTDCYRDATAAEYVAVDARNLARKPTALDDTAAAATPMPALTAWQALFSHGKLAPGQTVLVLGATGGVGSLAVQLARTAGARVVAYGRPSARDAAEHAGAHDFVEDEAGALESSAHDVDSVFDLVGGEDLGCAWSVARAGGAVVSVVEDSAARAETRSDARTAFFVVEPSGARLAALAEQIATQELRPVIGDGRPFAEAAGVRREAVGRHPWKERPRGQAMTAGRNSMAELWPGIFAWHADSNVKPHNGRTDEGR
jgi:NADPH:quinone reductase-like Zn-dependent oxidoreductase